MRIRFIVAFGLALLLGATVVRPALADSRSDARRYFNRGMTAIASERYEEGIRLLQRAYEIRPHPNVMFNLARAHEALGDFELALRAYREYLDTNPPDSEEVEQHAESLETRLRLRRMVDEGMAAISEGRYLEGVAFLQRAYDVEPHPNLLFNIARAYEQAGEAGPALRNFRAYLATNPDDAQEVRTRIAKLEAERETASETDGKSRGTGTGVDAERVAEIVLERLRAEGGLPSALPTVGPELRSVKGSTAAVGLEAKESADYEDVVVTASRRKQSPLDAPNAVTILTDEDIRLSGARSIPELLRRVPGMDVMAMSYSDWNVSMRGFNRRLANKILVLVDGRTVYQDFLGATVWSTLSIGLSDIERIEVIRGPGSAIYGAYAYTGIVNIITKRPEQLDGGEIELLGGNGGVMEGTLQYGRRDGMIGLRATAGYQRGNKFELEADPSLPTVSTGLDEPELSLERTRFDGQAELTLPDGRGRLYVGGGVNDGTNEVYGVSALRNQQVEGLIANLRAGYEGDLFSVLVFWDRIRAESRPQFFATGSSDLESEVRGDVIAVEPVLRPSFDLLGRHELVIGAEFRHKFIDWTYLDTSHEEDFFALFLQDQWAITEQWTLLVSGRVDRHPLIGFLGSPRGAVIFKPTEGQAIRLTVGTAFRQPTQSENYLELTSSSGALGVTLAGDRDLEAERILTVDLGYLAQADFGQLEVVGYFNRVQNLIGRGDLVLADPGRELDPDLGVFESARSLYENQDAEYFAFGSEIAARVYPTDGLDVGASYAFQYIYDRDSGDRFTDSPIHKVNAWGQLRTRFGLDLGVTVSWTSDQGWNEEVGNPEATSATDAIVRQVLPLPSYWVLSGRVGYRLFDDLLELAVAGSNLTQFGSDRERQHPLGNRLDARLYGSATVRF